MVYGRWLLLVLIIGSVYVAAKEKAFWNMRRSIEPISSPLSRAIVQMVGMAGGIYLALGVLEAFLNLELPERLKAYGLGLDPLALLSICLSVIQPYFLRLRNLFKKWKA